MAVFSNLLLQELRQMWHSGIFLVVMLLAVVFTILIDFVAIPFNKGLLPPVISLEAALLGFFLAAGAVFRERAEGTIQALRVSPAGTWHYILSKGTANVLLTLLYGLMTVFFTMGLKADYGRLLSILIPGSFLITILGMVISAHFCYMSGFVYSAVLAAMILVLPIFSYFLPDFQPNVFRLIPSYGVMFGLREILFSTSRDVFFYWQMVMSLTAEAFFMTLFSYWVLERKLMRGE